MSRYLERAENVARLLDIGLYLELDAASLNIEDGSAPVEIALHILACRDAFHAGHASADTKLVLDFLTFDRANPQSILSMIALARENARGTQESLGVDAWSEVNRLYLYLCSQRARRRFNSSPSQFYTTIKQACILFDGLVQNTLPRDEVYHFLEVGRYLERVNVMGRILHAKCRSTDHGTNGGDPAMQLVRWTGLLRSCSAYGAYLRVERDRVEPVGVIRFMNFEPRLPARDPLLRRPLPRVAPGDRRWRRR